MGPEEDLLPKHEGMCHSGHSDLIYTLDLDQSDQFPATCYYKETIKSLRATLTIWVWKRNQLLQGV